LEGFVSLSRRTLLKLGASAGAAVLLDRFPAQAQQPALIRKPIPSSGEPLPVIGLGSSQTFNLTRQSPEWETARQVLKLFRDLGGKVIDTAPHYGRSEPFIGENIQDLRIGADLFLATKVNVVSAGKQAAAQQMENSLRVFGRQKIDLMQVWNLGGQMGAFSDDYLAEHMEVVNEWKKAGRVRYVGITTSRDVQYADTEAALKKYPMDFVQLDYSIGDRGPEQRLLPLAKEKGIAVIANRPLTMGEGYSTGNLFSQVAGKALPPFAAEYDIKSWAQYFLKFVVSHPAVNVAIPGTGDPGHLRDNMGAGIGRLPDEATRRKMLDYFNGA
jgi:diketogulonate reductase-like aldo/keto reductase